MEIAGGFLFLKLLWARHARGESWEGWNRTDQGWGKQEYFWKLQSTDTDRHDWVGGRMREDGPTCKL